MVHGPRLGIKSTHGLWHRGPGGCRLGDVVRGSMKWVLASNYMVDMTWLLSACPDLLQAQEVVVVHGERTPDRSGSTSCNTKYPCFGSSVYS